MATPFTRFSGFTYSDAIPFEEGVTRRDPSPVIQVNETYYVWYSRTEKSLDGYSASVWYATSMNGRSWKEQGFLRLLSNDYGLRGRQLDVVSDGTISVLWRPVDLGHGGAGQANWD